MRNEIIVITLIMVFGLVLLPPVYASYCDDLKPSDIISSICVDFEDGTAGNFTLNGGATVNASTKISGEYLLNVTGTVYIDTSEITKPTVPFCIRYSSTKYQSSSNPAYYMVAESTDTNAIINFHYDYLSANEYGYNDGNWRSSSQTSMTLGGVEIDNITLVIEPDDKFSMYSQKHDNWSIVNKSNMNAYSSTDMGVIFNFIMNNQQIIEVDNVALCKGYSCDIGKDNDPPTVKSLDLTPNNTLSNNTIICNITPEDYNHTSLEVIINWYRNGTIQSDLEINVTVANNTAYYGNLTSGNLTPSDLWHCSAYVRDSIDASANSTSFNVSIVGDTPTYQLLSTNYSDYKVIDLFFDNIINTNWYNINWTNTDASQEDNNRLEINFTGTGDDANTIISMTEYYQKIRFTNISINTGISDQQVTIGTGYGRYMNRTNIYNPAKEYGYYVTSNGKIIQIYENLTLSGAEITAFNWSNGANITIEHNTSDITIWYNETVIYTNKTWAGINLTDSTPYIGAGRGASYYQYIKTSGIYYYNYGTVINCYPGDTIDFNVTGYDSNPHLYVMEVCNNDVCTNESAHDWSNGIPINNHLVCNSDNDAITRTKAKYWLSDLSGNWNNTDYIYLNIDKQPPNISLIDTFFKSNNYSNINQYTNNSVLLYLDYKDNMQINNLFANITYNTKSYYNTSVEVTSPENYSLIKTLDMNTWPGGVYDLVFFISDYQHDNQNYNLSYKWYKGNYTVLYYKNVTETQGSKFNINVSYNPDYITELNATFIYNDTIRYNVTSGNYSDHYYFNLSVSQVGILSQTESVINWSWNVTVLQKDDTSYNFNVSGTQTSYTLYLGECNATYPTKALNFSLYDINGTQTKLNGQIDLTMYYWLDNQLINKTFEIDNGSSQHFFTYCIYPENATITANYELYAVSDDYPQIRIAQDNLLLTKTVTQKNIYLTKGGINAYFNIIDGNNIPIDGVVVTMQKLIDGTYTTIETRTSDDGGLVTFRVNAEDNYKFTFVKESYTTGTFTLRPTTTDLYTITMGTPTTGYNYTTAYGIGYNFRPEGNLINNTWYNFTANATSELWHITGCIYQIKNNSGVIIDSANGVYTTALCVANITYNTQNYSALFTELNITLNNTYNYIPFKRYSVTHTYTGDLSLKNFLDDLKTFRVGGFDDWGLMLIGFIIIAGVTFTVGKSVKYMEANSELMLIMIICLTWLISWLGWFTMTFKEGPVGVIDVFINQYGLATLITLAGLGYITVRNT